MDKPARILVADDDSQFRRGVVRLLERAGYVVEAVGDADQALARLADHPFDLLVADVHMPGNQALAVLHAQSETPVVVVTGAPSVESAVGALRGAAVDYLPKPLDPARFLDRVAEGVSRGRMMRQLRDQETALRHQLEVNSRLQASLKVSGSHALGGPTPAEQPSGPQSNLPAVITAELSPREQDVLLAFRDSPQFSQVAEQLHISPNTVKNHFRSIYRKLKVSSQAELLAKLAEAERRG